MAILLLMERCLCLYWQTKHYNQYKATGYPANILSTHAHTPARLNLEVDELFACDHSAHHVTPVTAASPWTLDSSEIRHDVKANHKVDEQ